MSIQFLRARWNLSKVSEGSVRKPSADMARTVAISRVTSLSVRSGSCASGEHLQAPGRFIWLVDSTSS